jgi:hypothetical protein
MGPKATLGERSWLGVFMVFHIYWRHTLSRWRHTTWWTPSWHAPPFSNSKFSYSVSCHYLGCRVEFYPENRTRHVKEAHGGEREWNLWTFICCWLQDCFGVIYMVLKLDHTVINPFFFDVSAAKKLPSNRFCVQWMYKAISTESPFNVAHPNTTSK